MVRLDADIVEGLSRAYLLNRFDNPTPYAAFHRELWAMCCSDSPRVAVAAPRGHSKSTSVTFTWVLACVLFRLRDFVVIVSATETLANAFVKDLSVELDENEELRKAFSIKGFVKDTESEIIVSFTDGKEFRIIAKGALQRVRGMKWRNKRPNCFVIDDLEDDQGVLNKETRDKIDKWVFNALMPAGSKNCITRVVGTILHFSGFLQSLLDSPSWHSKLFSAHKSFDDFSDILWPEYFTEKSLRDTQAQYVEKGNPDGYSAEWLNLPLSSNNAFFRREWLLDFSLSDYDAPKTYYVGVDFAISQAQRADRTAMVVVGVNTYGVCFVEHVRKGRWDAKDILDNLFDIADQFDIVTWYMEAGAIQKSIGPFLNDEMVKRNVFFDITTTVPTKDKQSRAKAIQYRTRAGGVKFNKQADWWQDFEVELTTFPRNAKDDQVDAFALVGLHLDKIITPLSEEEEDEEDYQMMKRSDATGRNQITGY